jgi:hypothetical protein
MPVLAALLYLRLTSLKNFFRAQLRRLRQPKYLLGAVFVAAYFWFFVFRSFNSTFSTLGKLHGVGPGDPSVLVHAFGALALTGILTAMWTFSSDKPGLQFTEPEIAFLFPAPLSRRALIHFKLLSSLFSTGVQAVFFVLIFHRGRFFNVHAPQLLVGWWVLLSIISLHSLGSSLTIARLAEGGLRAGRRRALILGGLGAVGLATGWWIWHDMPDITNFGSIFDWAAAVLNGGALHWVLWPARLILQPLAAAGPSAYLLALAPAALVLAAHYWWVGRMDVAFEEASIAHAAHLATRRAEIQSKGVYRLGAPTPSIGRRPPFALANTRWVELAFLWKNLLSTRPWFTVRTWLICAVALIALSRGLSLWLGSSYLEVGKGLAILGFIGVAMALVYGPLITRLDIRQDLPNADILKTYPLPGWRIVLGQMLTPIVILSGIIWLALLAIFLGLNGTQPPGLSTVWFSTGMRATYACCAAGLTPFMLTLLLLVPNGAAILFPAVFRTVRTPGAGLDLMGQRLIFGFGQLFVLALVLAPGVGAGFSSIILQWLLGPAPAVILTTLLVMLVLAGESWCVLWWLGERFEKLDLSSELRA